MKNWQWSWGHAGKTGLNVIGLIPVLGMVKNADEVAALLKGGNKSTETAQDGAATLGDGATAARKSPEAPYSHIEDPTTVGSGKKFTQSQKSQYRDANMKANNGQLKSDISGEPLVPATKHQKGVTPPSNEAHVDHVTARSKGGSNSSSNAQIASRKENLKKSNK